MKKIVTVQDISCYGQCSITVALPILSAYGIETAILPSAILSTHTGCFNNFTVLDLTDEMPKIVNHWKEEGIKFDSLYTGYIGDYRQFEIIKSMQALLNPGSIVFVDPAMADHGRLYPALNDNIVGGMRSLIKEADIIVPNLTEAAFLLDIPYSESCSREMIEKMLKNLCEIGPSTSIMTGVSYSPDKIGAVAYNKNSGIFTEYFSEKIADSYHGTGDVFSSILLANLLNNNSMSDSLKNACEFVVKSIKNTLNDPSHIYGVKFESVLAEK